MVCVRRGAAPRHQGREPGAGLPHLRPGPAGRSRHPGRPPGRPSAIEGDDAMTTKKFMFVNRKAPYGTIYALESLEVVLITAAFDQDVSLVFLDDGVYQLKKGQQTKGIEMKNFSPTYRALEGYDVEKLYVERESLDGARPDRGRPARRRRRCSTPRRAGRADGRAGRRPVVLKGTDTMLHIVNKSPARPQLARRLPAHRPQPARILLIEDGVYAATRGSAVEAKLTAALAQLQGLRAAARPRSARHRRPRDRRRHHRSTTAASSTSSPSTTTCQSWL